MGRSAGGIGKHVALLAQALDGWHGIEIDIAAPPDIAVPLPKPVLPVAVPDDATGEHIVTIWALRRLISEGGYDLVHAHGLRAGIDGAVAGRSAGTPVIVTLHNLIRPETSGRAPSFLFRRAEIWVVGLATQVFVASNQMRDELMRRAPEQAAKVEVLHIGVAAPVVTRAAAAVRKELRIDDRTPLVVTVARLVPQKALDVMLLALTQVPAAVLVVVGDGPLLDELQRTARDLGVSDRVRFLGWRDAIGDYVAAADVFCLSSTWEARALAAQEAMVLGTPVVTTKAGGMGELIEDRVSGRLVPAGDGYALGAALQETLDDPSARAAYVAAARRRIGAFSNETMLERVRDRYLDFARGA